MYHFDAADRTEGMLGFDHRHGHNHSSSNGVLVDFGFYLTAAREA